MTEKNGFVEQTAKAYDMDYDIVYDIYIHYKDQFYEKLEEFIKNRAK
jgi:hypothetical protein